MKISFDSRIQKKRLLRIQRGRGYKYIYWINDEPYFEPPKGTRLANNWDGTKYISWITHEAVVKYGNDAQLTEEIVLFNKESQKYQKRKLDRLMKSYYKDKHKTN